MGSRFRAVVTVVAATALVVGVGATPSWASDAFFVAQALQARTIAQARTAAAAVEGTVATEDVPPAVDPVAVGTLAPDTATTLDAAPLGASVDFSGFQVDENLALAVTPLGESAAASAGSELAAQVLAVPFEVTATTTAGDEVTEFPAEPTFEDPTVPNPVLLDADPGVRLSIDVSPDELEGIDLTSVRIVTRENVGDPWTELPSYYDKATGAAVAVSDHLSQFAVIGVPFVAPRGPRIVLDPDDDVGTTDLPSGPPNELYYNLRLANALKSQLESLCLSDVMITRNDPAQPFVSRDFRAAQAAAWNPDITVTVAFNALTGTVWGGNPDEGGSLVWGRGTGADTALRDSLVNTLPGYTSRPAHVGSDPQYPWSEFGSLPGAMVHLETLFIDNSDDRGVLDGPGGWGYVTSGVATAIGQYAEANLGADCTDPVTGGWPSKPSAAELAQWKQLGYHYYQTYGGDPVSMSTGNLLEDEPLFTLNSPGSTDLDVKLVYNSQDGRESRVGTGWSFGLGARAQRFDDGSVLIVKGDGASVVFNPDGTGGYVPDADVHDTLVEAGLGQLKLTSTSGETWVFDAADIEGIGELASYRSALGTGYDLAYATPDGDDRFVPLASITDTAGQSIQVTQNAAGQIASLTHPDGRTWALGYGAGGDLTSITNPDGRTRTFTYDAGHRMLTAVDAAGVTYLRNQFDSAGRVVKQWDAAKNLREFDYTGSITAGGSTVYTNNEGAKTTYVWDELSRITKITDAAGGIEKFAYDSAGNTVKHTNQLGVATGYEYDTAGHLTKELLPDGTARSYTYTPLGVVASVTDAGGPGGAARTTTFDVTPTGLTTAAHLPDGGTVHFTYTPTGDLASVVDQAGNTTTFAYDTVGNLIAVTDPLGQTTTNSFDTAGHVVATMDPTGATTQFVWDAGDRLVSSTDPLGAVTVYGYDALDHVTSVTDALGATTGFTWDAMFHLTAVTAPDGGVTRYEYDGEDNLTAAVDPLGARTVIARDQLGRAIKTTDALGNTSTSVFDALGQLTAATDPLGAATQYAYDDLGQLTQVTDPTGAATTSVYDAVGRLAAVTDALGGTTSYTYTLADQVASVTDQQGKSTKYTYDPVGNIVATTDRRGQKSVTGYDALGRVTSEADPTGAATTYAYDAVARTVATTNPLGAVTTTLLDAVGRAVQVTNPLGSTTRATYDAVGNLLTTTDANGAVTTAAYDVSGRVTALTNALGAVSKYSYDLNGQVTRATNPLGAATGYQYDPLGHLTQVTDGMHATPTAATGTDVNVTTQYAYTAAGQLAKITNPMGAVTTYGYDVRGLPVAETNPLGVTSRTGYDALGRAVTSTDGNGATTSTSYTSRSDVAAVSYPDGTKVQFEYDADQHPIVMTDSLGATGWAYDTVGRMTKQTDPTGTTLSYGYDRAGQTTTLAASGHGTIGYTYDPAGQLTGQTSPWGSLGYAYDPAGNLTTQTRSTGVTTTYQHDAIGEVTQIQHHTPVVAAPTTSKAAWVEPSDSKPTDVLKECPNGTHTSTDTTTTTEQVASYLKDRAPPTAGTIAGCEKTATYAAKKDFPAAADVFTAGQNITYDYQYDPAGNVSKERETLGSQSVTDTSYLYDDLDRLSQSFDTAGVVNTYLYDKAGDRTAWITPVAPDTGEMLIATSAYNAAGQLTSQYQARPTEGATTVANTYDRAGNRTSEATSSPDGSSTTNYSYTSTGRLKEVSEDDVSTTYGYDGLGRNLTTTQDSWASTTTTQQSWDGLQPVVQSTDTGADAMLLRDPTGLVALQSAAASDGSSGTLWNLQDRLGSTIATTTGGGYVTDLADYSDYGIATHTSQGFAGATGFTGETSSPTTGLNSYYARTYQPFTGTWLTPDTYRGTIADPGSQTRYGYVGGNPVTSRDAYGFSSCDDTSSYNKCPATPTSGRASSKSGKQHYGGGYYSSTGYPSYATGTVARNSASSSASGGGSCQSIAYTPICSSKTSVVHTPTTISGQCGGSMSFDQRPCTINDIPGGGSPETGRAILTLLAGLGIGLAAGACIVATVGICGVLGAVVITAGAVTVGAGVGAGIVAITPGGHETSDYFSGAMSGAFGSLPIPLVAGLGMKGAIEATEEGLLAAANAARDAEVIRLGTLPSSQRPATVVGAFNVATGEVAVGQSSKEILQCAETCAVNLLGGDRSSIFFTTAVRPKSGGVTPGIGIPVCTLCELEYGRSAFPDPATIFEG